MIVTITAAITFCLVTINVRLQDARSPIVSDAALDDQGIGVFIGTDSFVSLAPKPYAYFTNLGGETPELRWSIDLKPGPTNHARVSLVVFEGPELWQLDLASPVNVIFQIPDQARLLPDDQELRALPESFGACASWFDGDTTRYALPAVGRSALGDQLLTCSVPAVGQISDIFFEIAFEWEDETLSTVGYGRDTSWVRILDQYSWPSDIELPADGNRALTQPVEVRLTMDTEQRLLNAFPDPSGGGFSERRWLFERGGDLEYTLERPRRRTFIAPVAEISLLLAGVALGLLPSSWRQRPRGPHGAEAATSARRRLRLSRR